MLEVQNCALIKTAGERAQRISKLEREAATRGAGGGPLKAEREYYHNRVLALEQHNREVTEAATQYSLWGQSLERELAKIQPDGACARGFGTWSASQTGTLKKEFPPG